MAAVSLQANVAHFSTGTGYNRQPAAQEPLELHSNPAGSTSYCATAPSRPRFTVAALHEARTYWGSRCSSVRNNAFTGSVQLSHQSPQRQLSSFSQKVGVRAEQGQKEREGTSGPVQNVLKEIKNKGGVEAVKAGAEAARNEAQQDLNWYRSLNKPWFAPPEPVYGIVWTGLYALMAVATWMVITEGGGFQKQALPLAVFVAQLFLNFRWPQLFFVDKKIGAAQIDNLFLLASLLLTYQLYHNVSPTAGLLILPSVVWVGFANVLNYVILVQNQDN